MVEKWVTVTSHPTPNVPHAHFAVLRVCQWLRRRRTQRGWAMLEVRGMNHLSGQAGTCMADSQEVGATSLVCHEDAEAIVMLGRVGHER